MVAHSKELNTKLLVEKIPKFEYGVVWEDPVSGHRIGCLDASQKDDVEKLMHGEKAILAIQDPPYNVDINDEFGNLPIDQYIHWSEQWIDNTIDILDANSSLYVWLGADIKNGLQPLPDFIIMMRSKPVRIRNFITMSNQRGYGTLDIVDAFIFVGVWVDKILYWVLTNKEVNKHPLRSHQHRGGIEYQIGITAKNINEFEKYLVEPSKLVPTIKSKVK